MRFLLPRAAIRMCGALSLFLWMGCASDAPMGSGHSRIASSFSLVTVNPSNLAIPSGGGGYATVTLTRSSGFNDAISLSVDALPRGVVASGSIPAGESSGRISIQVARDVPPQTIDGLQLRAQSRSIARTAVFTLTVSPALPAGTLSPNLVNASGGKQLGGALENTSITLEPVAPGISTDSYGQIETRHAFFPK